MPPTSRVRTGVVAAVVLLAGLAGCGDDGATVTADATTTLLPGLETVEGTEPLGRPLVAPRTEPDSDDPEGTMVVKAAYRVTAEDPLAVLRAWAEQLRGFPVTGLEVGEGHDGAAAAIDAAYEPGGFVFVELWETEDDPILLVSLALAPATGRDAPLADDLGDTEIGTSSLAWEERTDGVLFTEQGDDIEIPEGARTLSPTVPVAGGTGGSSTVLAAEDGAAALEALLASAPEGADQTGPVTCSTEADLEVCELAYAIWAGGWSFDATSVRGPGDDEATIYVTSAAD